MLLGSSLKRKPTASNSVKVAYRQPASMPISRSGQIINGDINVAPSVSAGANWPAATGTGIGKLCAPTVSLPDHLAFLLTLISCESLLMSLTSIIITLVSGHPRAIKDFRSLFTFVLLLRTDVGVGSLQLNGVTRRGLAVVLLG